MTQPDQHDEHGRSTGGVRGAINDLLGRGDDDGARPDGQHAEDRKVADPRPPADALFDGRTAEQQRSSGAAGSGAGGGAGVVGAAAPEQHGVGDRRPDDRPDDRPGSTPGSARHTDVGQDGPGYAAPAGARTVDVGGRADASPSSDPATTRPATTDPATADPATADRRTGHDDNDGRTGPAAGAGASTVPSGSGAGSVAHTSQGEDSSGRERLVSTDRAESYGSRWDAVKGEFVDEPRKAVADADALVGELLDELQTLFTEQRKGIERSLAADETSTEDMRLALRRYRSFFDRLLSI